jgi:hypothetical protein
LGSTFLAASPSSAHDVQVGVPRLATLQPREAGGSGLKAWVARGKQKVGWSKHFTLVFLCEASSGECCSASEGIPVSLPGATLVKLAPLLKAAAAVLKVAATVGRVYGLPLPAGVPFAAFASSYSEELEAGVAAAVQGEAAATQAAQKAAGHGSEGALESNAVRELLPPDDLRGALERGRCGGLTKVTTGDLGVLWLCAESTFAESLWLNPFR